jgi:NAD(P)-dependent dehydrogenase (short-subunit alcohol dehydrogenase family)
MAQTDGVNGELEGRVAIVTGASRGIGRALAVGLAERGAAVVCAARTVDKEPSGLPGTIHTTADAITAAGGRALAVRCDVGVASDLENLVERTLAEFGRIDVLVNNAMAPTRGAFTEMTVDMWDESMAANVRSLFVLAKLVVPPMTEQGGGSIINISSGGADHAAAAVMPPGFVTYVVAKAAMERFTSGLAPELRDLGITVNALRPGAVKTELATREMGEGFDWTGWTEPEAVVPAAAFLATQIGTDFTGRIVDSTTFGRQWP